jgi:hypothetical protein
MPFRQVRVPWQKWIKFFHPRNSSGSVQVLGPGTNLKGDVVPLLVTSISVIEVLQQLPAGGSFVSMPCPD